MKDSAVKGLASAKQAGQLRKDANVQEKKSDIGKRDNYGGSLLSSSSNNLFVQSANRVNSSNIRNILSNSSNQDIEAKKRIKNNQQIEKAINIMKKIPGVSKYAKMAELAQKVQGAKAKKVGLMGNILGKNTNPSMSDIEDAKAAEDRGEEYNPEDSEGKYTAKLDKKTKLVLLLVLGIILFANIFLCIIVVASITGGGKESYLASREKLSEQDVENSYSNDNLTINSSSSDSNHTFGNVKSDSTSNIILVGDSRTEGLCQSVYNGTSCSTLGYKVGNTVFIAESGQGYFWLNSTALSQIKTKLDANKKSTVFINLGTNGLSEADSYAKIYNQLAKDYKEANIVAVSVTPIIDSKVTDFKDTENDANVVKFNNKLKSSLSSDVIYCDVYSKVKGKVDAFDGVHYDNASYKLINDEMMNCIKGNASGIESSFDSLLSKGETSVSKLNQNNIKQLVIVESNGSNGLAKVYFYENSNNGWKIDSSLTTSGHVGEGGTIAADKHSEKIKKTPRGLYAIGQAFYKNNMPKTGLETFKIYSNTYWIDDPASKYYNKRVEGNANKDWSSYEDMSAIDSYRYGFVIEFNTNPIVPGLGSAIFFHIDHESATSGCVSVPEDKVLAYLAKLDSTKKPYILII